MILRHTEYFLTTRAGEGRETTLRGGWETGGDAEQRRPHLLRRRAWIMDSRIPCRFQGPKGLFFDEADFFTPKSIPLAAATALGKKYLPKIAGRRYHIVPRREEWLVTGVIFPIWISLRCPARCCW